MTLYEYTAPCHFGMEAVLKREIYDLGYEIEQVEDGKVTFIGDASVPLVSAITYEKKLDVNAKYTIEYIATMLGATGEEIAEIINQLEKDDLIRGYKAVIDWEKLDGAYVSAVVELNVVPKAGLGFEEVAEKIMKYNEVESVYLMSGNYDLNIIVKGKTLQDIARFVAKELATIDAVNSTATHFILRRYKELDIVLCDGDYDDRGSISL